MYNETVPKPKTAQATSTPPPHPFAYNPATAVPFAALATSEPLDPVQGLRELIPSEGSGKSHAHPESEVLSRGAGMRSAGGAAQSLPHPKSQYRERESRDSVGMGTFGLGPGPETEASQRQRQTNKVSATTLSVWLDTSAELRRRIIRHISRWEVTPQHRHGSQCRQVVLLRPSTRSPGRTCITLTTIIPSPRTKPLASRPKRCMPLGRPRRLMPFLIWKRPRRMRRRQARMASRAGRRGSEARSGRLQAGLPLAICLTTRMSDLAADWEQAQMALRRHKSFAGWEASPWQGTGRLSRPDHSSVFRSACHSVLLCRPRWYSCEADRRSALAWGCRLLLTFAWMTVRSRSPVAHTWRLSKT